MSKHDECFKLIVCQQHRVVIAVLHSYCCLVFEIEVAVVYATDNNARHGSVISQGLIPLQLQGCQVLFCHLLPTVMDFTAKKCEKCQLSEPSK